MVYIGLSNHMKSSLSQVLKMELQQNGRRNPKKAQSTVGHCLDRLVWIAVVIDDLDLQAGPSCTTRDSRGCSPQRPKRCFLLDASSRRDGATRSGPPNGSDDASGNRSRGVRICIMDYPPWCGIAATRSGLRLNEILRWHVESMHKA